MPILLKASQATLFEYAIENVILEGHRIAEINQADGERGFQLLLANLLSSKPHIVNIGPSHTTFKNNLMMVDTLMPEILTRLTMDSYLHQDLKIVPAVERLSRSNPLHFDLTEGQDFYGLKIKSFLVNLALGMQANKPWNGKYETMDGGIATEKEFIPFNYGEFDRLSIYLLHKAILQHTRLERGSLCKQQNGNLHFSIALQVAY